MKPLAWPRFGIFSRIYLFGVLQLACMAVATAILIESVVDPIEQADSIRVGAWIADRIWTEPDAAKRNALIHSLRGETGIEVALYDAAGRAIRGADDAGSNALNSVTLARAVRERSFFEEQLDAFVIGHVVDGRLAGVTVARARPSGGFALGVGALLSILAVLALLAWPLARSLSVPIRRLNHAVTRFGRGEMDARARLSRSDELGELSRAHDEMAERIVALLSAEKLLIAGVAHELRTPLQRIRVAIELASEESEMSAQAAERFESMLDDLRELEHIITNVLTIARLESARAGANHELLRRRESINPVGLLRDCALRFEMRHPERVLESMLEDELPDLFIERHLMAMAISNLLENAREYSAAAAPIGLRAWTHGGRVHIEVVDRGIGIQREHLAAVFKPFFRTDPARSRSQGGAGLGLAIVKGVVDAHAGEVSVHSAQGEGARFRISLPIGAVVPLGSGDVPGNTSK